MKNLRVTPGTIDRLTALETVVIPSNLDPTLNARSTRSVTKKFGGQPNRIHGQDGSIYLIPIRDGETDLDMGRVARYVANFVQDAATYPEMKFYVADFPIDLVSLFVEARNVDNIYLPQEFWDILSTNS